MSRTLCRYDLLQSLGVEQLEPLVAKDFVLEEEDGEAFERPATIPCIMTRPVSSLVRFFYTRHTLTLVRLFRFRVASALRVRPRARRSGSFPGNAARSAEPPCTLIESLGGDCCRWVVRDLEWR